MDQNHKRTSTFQRSTTYIGSQFKKLSNAITPSSTKMHDEFFPPEKLDKKEVLKNISAEVKKVRKEWKQSQKDIKHEIQDFNEKVTLLSAQLSNRIADSIPSRRKPKSNSKNKPFNEYQGSMWYDEDYYLGNGT
eukprot:UN19346